MPLLSWNEIRHNAIRFSNEWTGETREHAEAKSFWDEFFAVFGIRRRTVASFEEPVKKISGDYGYIDLFWPGVLIVEHKSFSHDLGKAQSQAFRYIQDLARDPERQKEVPRYIIVSDFARIALHDLEPDEQRGLPLFDQRRVATLEFPLADFHHHIQSFAFIPGYKQHKLAEQDPANFQAVELLGLLHDALEAGGYNGHNLERFLVRVLFCLFAEDTGLFERESFKLYIENRTASDGSDLGTRLAQLFHILNTPAEKRQQHLDEELTRFPYVNGELFSEQLGFADFNKDMRNALLACTRFQWSQISPAIFGSLFQAVMEPRERRQIGGHYTSERDILKVIHSLFLDDLRAQFLNRKNDKSTARRARLEEFHKKLCSLKLFDPACGCGNFLVVAYRELRQLELETLKELFGQQTELTLDQINRLSQVDVDQFYGIEIGEWPARIAEVALWLMDHQMNLKVSEVFGQLYQRLPLKKSPHIHCANALRIDWKSVLPPGQCSYVLGNPPFVGHQWRSPDQQGDMEIIWGTEGRFGRLDYVTCWYLKAADFIQGTTIRCAFVSTNSITQGEQVSTLWTLLFAKHIKINFAHRTFSWESEARGKAHVHVVIIGFSQIKTSPARLYDYEGGKGKNATVSECENINPYLICGPNLLLPSRTDPREGFPQMKKGSQPTDGGHLILTDEERADLIKQDPAIERWLRMYLGGEELVNGAHRWCLWLKHASPAEIRRSPALLRRVEAVRENRLKSPTASVRAMAEQATLFTQDRQPTESYLAVPEVTSQNRKYIPIGFLSPDIVASNKLQIIVGGDLFHFGVLTSQMHMAWVKVVSGRLKSDYSYAPSVYNNFPWPTPTPDQRARIQETAKAVLETRESYLRPKGTATLADLYDPLSMPPALVKVHAELDRAVEKSYRPEPFHSDRERVEFLFALYEKLTAPLLPVSKTKSRKRQP
jgi:hypothetical protein